MDSTARFCLLTTDSPIRVTPGGVWAGKPTGHRAEANHGAVVRCERQPWLGNPDRDHGRSVGDAEHDQNGRRGTDGALRAPFRLRVWETSIFEGVSLPLFEALSHSCGKAQTEDRGLICDAPLRDG